MNHHPVHTNVDYAQNNQHGKFLWCTLIFSIVVGITVPDISGKAIANLEYENIKHLAPVFIGDALYTKPLFIKRIKSKSDRGIVYVKQLYNQKYRVLALDDTFLLKNKSMKELSQYLMRS